jgi:hypothetical protein
MSHTEVTIGCCLAVDGFLEAELLHDHTWTEIEVVANDINELLISLLSCTIGIDEDRKRLGNTDGVRKLNKRATSKASRQEGLGCRLFVSSHASDQIQFGNRTDPAGSVSS